METRVAGADPRNTLDDLERRADEGGGEDRVKRQHDAGKLTARERVDLLFDTGTFEEIDKLVTHRCTDFGMEQQLIPGDGVVAGHGRIDGPHFTLSGLVAGVDGTPVIRDTLSGPVETAEAIGLALAEILLGRGADAVLQPLTTPGA
jgi:acetyl-CoA carboxylase carboxyltransferase component